MNSIVIAFTGKGGVGKTILSALTGRILFERGMSILYVDADPAGGLTTALAIDKIKTIGEARVEIIEKARMAGSEEEKASIADMVDYLLLESLYEGPRFSLLSMGQTDTLGCYCPINNLLKNTITTVGLDYDCIIIDAEAGIEQVNRQVINSVNYSVIVTDNSLRGAKTSVMINDCIKRIPDLQPESVGVIFNRVNDASENLVSFIEDTGLNIFGVVPPDQIITGADCAGESLFDIPASSTALSTFAKILISILSL